ncbi:MAG: NeuD/PglB/VioB family sugar acetyltransferase [Hyphomicrobiaceae bacterium]|nr:NeuD/PglB/VioB family sugar acetyltransferase [Hyphomicrobiaceae bacterium]MCC0006637.1 NeuD/PglB/VioB family sugar acetyltransferase [Hyphomicrobiaceae bacterium]
MANKPSRNRPKPTPVLILGSTNFSEEVVDLVSETATHEVVGFVENINRERCQDQFLGMPIHWVDQILELVRSCQFLCGIGTTRRKGYIEHVATYGAQFATLIHPTSHRSATSSIGAGTILGVNSILAAHAHIGEHVIVNRSASVGHHTRIGCFTTIGPGANIAGRCTIGSGTYIGIGATVVDGLTIGSNAVIGAGSVVVKDVPDNVCVMGVPARIVKTGVDGR